MTEENERSARELLAVYGEKLLQKAIDRSYLSRTTASLTDDILTAMHGYVAKQDWGPVCFLNWVVQSYPDRRFTPLLCELLDAHWDDVYMEAIADAFWDIADERAIPHMIAALDIYIAGDDDRHFSRKLISAMAKINTPEAIEGIRVALLNEDEKIRDEADSALRFLEEERNLP